VITINATINRRRGDPDLNRDTGRRGGVDRTLARDRVIGVREGGFDADDLDAGLDGAAAARPCDLSLATLRRRASGFVWVRVVATTPCVRVAEFTACLR
jgi:hypothetical protein